MFIEVGFGSGTQSVEVPDGNLMGVLAPNRVECDLTGVDEVIRALENPIGTPRLRDIVRPGERIAVVTSDITRPFPTYAVMPALLDELYAAGVDPADVTLVFALGSHRFHTEEERRHLAGERAWREIRCIDGDPSSCVHVGKTKAGTPVDIVDVVADADRRICLGNIEYHYFAGYSGGAKALMPGVSTREAIENLWGAKVVDFYGLSDIYGACAAACEAHDGLHIVEDQILVETVDPATGEVLAPGETGELVFTTLMKKARPMIRFRTGDIGYVSTDTCECGRTLARIHVTGRKDEMFIVGAVNVFPSDVEFVVRGLEGLTGEYSIRVYEKDFTCKYEVSVERAQGSDEPYDEVAARTEAALKAHTGVRPAKVIVYDAGKLGTSSEHKASRFIDERCQ